VVGNSSSDGLAPARVDLQSRAGYVDRTGKWVIPPRYIVAFPFQDGLARSLTEDRRPCYITREDQRVWCGEPIPERH